MSDYAPISRPGTMFRPPYDTAEDCVNQAACIACDLSNESAVLRPSSSNSPISPNPESAVQLAYERGFINGWRAAMLSAGSLDGLGMTAELEDEIADYWNNFKVGGTD